MINRVIFAIPNTSSNDVLYEYLTNIGLNVYRGSELDVLSRYYQCAKECDADLVVRITADCPFIDAKLVDSTIKYHIETDADYTSNHFPPTFPDGFDVEVINFAALKKAWLNATSSLERTCHTIHKKK